ncbi:WD40-repeat-containing domain protein [Amylostereum chailletii]|nr:WD40-repeat-containing domain protein [Amylostereum chailletii]
MNDYSLLQNIPSFSPVVRSISTTRDCRLTAVSGSDGKLAIYAVPSLRLVYGPRFIPSPSSACAITALAWSAVTGGILFVGDVSSVVRLIQLGPVQKPGLGALYMLSTLVDLKDGEIQSIAIFGDRVAVSTLTRVTLMNEVFRDQGTLGVSLAGHFTISHSQPPIYQTPSALFFMNKSTLIVTYSERGAIAWNIDQRDCVWKIDIEPDGIFHASLSPDGRKLVTTSHSQHVNWYTITKKSPSAPQVDLDQTVSLRCASALVLHLNNDIVVVYSQFDNSLRIVSPDVTRDVQTLQLPRNRGVPAPAFVSTVDVGSDGPLRYIIAATTLQNNSYAPSTISIWAGTCGSITSPCQQNSMYCLWAFYERYAGDRPLVLQIDA